MSSGSSGINNNGNQADLPLTIGSLKKKSHATVSTIAKNAIPQTSDLNPTPLTRSKSTAYHKKSQNEAPAVRNRTYSTSVTSFNGKNNGMMIYAVSEVKKSQEEEPIEITEMSEDTGYMIPRSEEETPMGTPTPESPKLSRASTLLHINQKLGRSDNRFKKQKESRSSSIIEWLFKSSSSETNNPQKNPKIEKSDLLLSVKSFDFITKPTDLLNWQSSVTDFLRIKTHNFFQESCQMIHQEAVQETLGAKQNKRHSSKEEQIKMIPDLIIDSFLAHALETTTFITRINEFHTGFLNETQFLNQFLRLTSIRDFFQRIAKLTKKQKTTIKRIVGGEVVYKFFDKIFNSELSQQKKAWKKKIETCLSVEFLRHELQEKQIAINSKDQHILLYPQLTYISAIPISQIYDAFINFAQISQSSMPTSTSCFKINARELCWPKLEVQGKERICTLLIWIIDLLQIEMGIDSLKFPPEKQANLIMNGVFSSNEEIELKKHLNEIVKPNYNNWKQIRANSTAKNLAFIEASINKKLESESLEKLLLWLNAEQQQIWKKIEQKDSLEEAVDKIIGLYVREISNQIANQHIPVINVLRCLTINAFFLADQILKTEFFPNMVNSHGTPYALRTDKSVNTLYQIDISLNAKQTSVQQTRFFSFEQLTRSGYNPIVGFKALWKPSISFDGLHMEAIFQCSEMKTLDFTVAVNQILEAYRYAMTKPEYAYKTHRRSHSFS